MSAKPHLQSQKPSQKGSRGDLLREERRSPKLMLKSWKYLPRRCQRDQAQEAEGLKILHEVRVVLIYGDFCDCTVRNSVFH